MFVWIWCLPRPAMLFSLSSQQDYCRQTGNGEWKNECCWQGTKRGLCGSVSGVRMCVSSQWKWPWKYRPSMSVVRWESHIEQMSGRSFQRWSDLKSNSDLKIKKSSNLIFTKKMPVPEMKSDTKCSAVSRRKIKALLAGIAKKWTNARKVLSVWKITINILILHVEW